MKSIFLIAALLLSFSGASVFAESGQTPAVANSTAASTKAVLSIKGMMCSSCASTVKSALEGVKGVQSAKVDQKKNLAFVSYDSATTNTDAMIKAVTDAGYTAKIQ